MKKVIIFAVALFVAIPVVAFAATIHGGESYTLPKDQTNDGSLYAGAGTLTIAGTVTGDLVIAGGQATISGDIKQDILIGAGTVDLSGTVGGDVRVAGGQISIDTNVPGDVLVAGGTVTLTTNSVVGGDVLMAGGSLAINGEVKGQIKAAGGEIFIAGPVGGNVDLIGKTIKLESTAKLAGDFSYQSPEQATIADGATIAGKTTFTKRNFDTWGRFSFGLFGITIISWIIGLVTLLAAAIVFVVAVKRFTGKVVEHSLKAFWQRLLLGLVLLVVTPFVIGILFVSVIGSMLGVILTGIYLVYLMLAAVYGAIVAGSWIFRLAQKGTVRYDWVSAIIGVVVLQLLNLVPVIGWIFTFAFFLVALGSLTMTKMDLLQGK